eukprot:evm.model.NODE_27596_length_23439_cov_34.245060.2
MSACTYTNVQLSGGNIKSLLNVKRKSSTGTGGKGEGEEGGEEDLSLLVEELEEGTDSDEGDSSEGYTPVTIGQGQKRGAPLSLSASSALSMSSLSSGGSRGALMARKRVRSSSSSSSSSSSRGGGVVSLEESLAADEGLEGEEGGEEGSQGNTSAGALSGYSSSLSGQEDEDEEEGDYGEDEDEDEGEEDIHHSFPSSQAVKHRQSNQQQHHHQQQQQQNNNNNNNNNNNKGLKPLDVNALPTFSTDVLPAPSPRGADDFFPSYLAAYDPMGDSASSPWAWAEPPVSGSLSSLSLETGCGMTSLNSLDEGLSNHSAFARDEDKGGDPLGFSADGDVEKFNKYRAAEIKHGRVAMLAMLHTLVTGLGVKLPGLVAAGDGIPQSMPFGIGAVTSGAWAAQGWAQVLLFASALEVLAPQKEDKIPGDVQPDTAAFAKLDEKSEEEALAYQNKELNNGRLAMVSWLGAVVGASLTGGEDPVATLLHKLGN